MLKLKETLSDFFNIWERITGCSVFKGVMFGMCESTCKQYASSNKTTYFLRQ